MLDIKQLGPTRDRLKDAALVLSSLQRLFLPKHPRQWQYGLEVNMRGLITQPFTIENKEYRASIDLVRHKVRLDNNNWKLADFNGPKLYQVIESWLKDHGVNAELEKPTFSKSQIYNPDQANDYSLVLWWLDLQFQILKADISEGVTSPIFLYAHHFDLSLVWFPYDDERQLSVGWSTGDENISEPYIYLTAYPEPDGFQNIKLPAPAYWQNKGFSGAILPYAKLTADSQPEALFRHFAAETFAEARPLLD